MKFKMHSLEKRWVLYDVGNSAFTLMVSTIIPIYFNYLAENAGISDVNYLAFWGYAASVSTVLVALLGPVLGSVSDLRGRRKGVFLTVLLLGSAGCIFLGFLTSWIWFLVLFVLTRTAYSLSLVIYDSMLPDVTTEERMDELSARGYAWGYIGSCIPFVICLLLVLFCDRLGLSMAAAMGIAFVVTAVWWLGMSLPLLRLYRQTYYVETASRPVRGAFRNLGMVFGELRKNKKTLFFLVAFFFYIDGVYTIIDMATAYGTALGLDTTGLLLALLMTQLAAFPAALVFGRLSRKYAAGRLIGICIAAYFCIAIYGMFLTHSYQFWILAFCVGIFQGAVQSLSRSYFARLIPPGKSGEYFGIYDIFGKGASFMGTMLVSVVSQASGSTNLGVGALAVLFLIGFLLFRQTDKIQEKGKG